MADPTPTTRKQPASEEGKIVASRNDPTPGARTGDSRFLPVVILSLIALLIILAAAVVLIRGKGHKIVPTEQPNTSNLVQTLPTSS